MKFLLPVLICAMLGACGSSRAVYKYHLKKVSRGDGLADESRLIQNPLVFENPDFKIIWSPGPLTFFFRIENKSKTELQINFDKAFLISPSGNAFSAGHPGNSAMAGHRDGLFRPLKDVKVGDEIRFRTTREELRYRVTKTTIVTPDDLSVLEPQSGQATLTLITCYPFYYVGTAPKRFVVHAARE